MKKLRSIIALVLVSAMLVGCADKKKGSAPEFSDSPFSNSDTSSKPQTGSDEDYFIKFQTDSIKFELTDELGAELEYNGGELEFHFDTDTEGNTYDAEHGFMAFINGIPQMLSLNGGEPAELVRVSQQPDQKGSVMLSLTPTVTEEMSAEETLQFKLVTIFNPSYKPQGSYVGFGNAHNGSSYLEKDMRVKSPLAVSKVVSKPTADVCESVLITDDVAKEYGITKPGTGTVTMIALRDAQTKSSELVLREGKLNAEILMYGGEEYDYRVYLYVNCERIPINGGDYLETTVKSGHLNVFKTELENISERDIIYAIAVPLDPDSLFAVRKSPSLLVLGESDVTDAPPAPSQPETPPDELPSNGMYTSIYAYFPDGYIDDGQRYLLLSRYSFNSHSHEHYDFIVYDEVTKKTIAAYDDGYDDVPYYSYGEGVITVCVQNYDEFDPTLPLYVVYNERFEPVKELYADDPEVFFDKRDVKYSPSKKLWYYNTLDDCFYAANEDFSEKTKLAEHEIRKYFVLDNKIAYYRINYEYPDKSNNADFFGIMDLNGNVIGETQVSDAGRANFRLKKAGDYICFMSGYKMDMDYTFDTPMDGIIFYNWKTGEQKTFRPEHPNENTFCQVTPDGKYLVTGVIDPYVDFLVNGVTIKLYDIESGELVESGRVEKDDMRPLAFSVYNDRALLMDWNALKYMFNTQ